MAFKVNSAAQVANFMLEGSLNEPELAGHAVRGSLWGRRKRSDLGPPRAGCHAQSEVLEVVTR